VAVDVPPTKERGREPVRERREIEMTLRERGISPAFAVAVLALIVAIAGSAFAGPSATESAIGAKKVKKIAKKAGKKAGRNAARAQVGAILSGITVQQDAVQVPAASFGAARATCPAGKFPLGGGGGTPVGSDLLSSQPSAGPSGNPVPSGQKFDTWYVGVRNNNPSTITVRAYMICG
jgi:hypothetical protein